LRSLLFSKRQAIGSNLNLNIHDRILWWLDTFSFDKKYLFKFLASLRKTHFKSFFYEGFSKLDQSTPFSYLYYQYSRADRDHVDFCYETRILKLYLCIAPWKRIIKNLVENMIYKKFSSPKICGNSIQIYFFTSEVRSDEKNGRAKFIGDWDYISRNLTRKIKNKLAENRLKCSSSWCDSSEMEIEGPVRNSHINSFSLKTSLILLYFFLFFSN
jgi:hypothetical protein